jgi:hypothetical protein
MSQQTVDLQTWPITALPSAAKRAGEGLGQGRILRIHTSQGRRSLLQAQNRHPPSQAGDIEAEPLQHFSATWLLNLPSS